MMTAAAVERDKRCASATALRGALESIRQTSKPEPLNMNTSPPSPPRDPKDVVIEFNDDWIVINGKSFSSEPLLIDVVELMGEPDAIAMDTLEEDGYHWDARHFIWLDIGLVARTTEGVTPKYHPSSQHASRLERINHIALYVDRPISLQERIRRPDAAISQSVYVYDKSKVVRRCAGQAMNEVGDRRLVFQGKVLIAGVEITKGMTPHEVMSKKRGKPLIQDYWKSSGAYPWAGCGTHDHGVTAWVASTDRAADWLHSPIRRVELQFENWWNPTYSMNQELRLAFDEYIVNSFDNEEHKSQWGEFYSLPEAKALGIGFEAVLTNKRLMIRVGEHAPLVEWSLLSAPELTVKGEERIALPPKLAKWRTKSSHSRDQPVTVVEISSSEREEITFMLHPETDNHIFKRQLNTFKNRIDSAIRVWGPETSLPKLRSKVVPALSSQPHGVSRITREVEHGQTTHGLMLCGKCQKPIADDALRCLHCGTPNTPGRKESELIPCKSKEGITKFLCDLTVTLTPGFIKVLKRERLNPFAQPEETWIPVADITSPKVSKHTIWPFPERYKIELPRPFSSVGQAEALTLWTLDRLEAEAIRDHVLAKYKQPGTGEQAS